LRAGNTALLALTCRRISGEGGFLHRIGGDYTQTRVCIEPIRKVLAAVREAGFHVIYTREGHRPDYV